MKTKKGFSMVEMLAATSVFVLLALMVSQLVTGASLSITGGRKAMDADSQARFIFSRMAQDFNRMLKRADVDMIFAKQDDNRNDKIFFYSEVAAAYDRSVSSSAKNPVSLVGYRVEADPYNNEKKLLQLERLGLGLTWDETDDTSGVVFLSYGTSGPAIAGSTLDTHRWHGQGSTSNLIGSPPRYDDGPDAKSAPDYHVIGDQVFRFEYCFLLNSGTYSSYPVKQISGGSLQIASGEPDEKTTGNVGDRRFDTSGGRGYICQNKISTTNGDQMVWRPAGVQDVAAIVVAIAVLDPASRKLVPNQQTMDAMAEEFADADNNLRNTNPENAILMEQSWKELINDSKNFAQRTGIPLVAAGQIKIYQRYFYLNNPPSQDSSQ